MRYFEGNFLIRAQRTRVLMFGQVRVRDFIKFYNLNKPRDICISVGFSWWTVSSPEIPIEKYFFWSIGFVYWAIDLIKCIFLILISSQFWLPPIRVHSRLRMYRGREYYRLNTRIFVSIKSLDYIYLARIIQIFS